MCYNDSNEAEFEYEFQIEASIVKYNYVKTSYRTLVSEHLCIDGKEVISFERRNGNTTFTSALSGTETSNSF